MLTIDGSMGEGGGQILRTALSLSLATGQPFRIERIRAGRPKPGLQAQHLTAVQAAAAISDAQVDGADKGSTELTFRPQPVKPGQYSFAVGTAGSATLVLQTLLPALMTATGPTALVLEGGTHNPYAPPYDFLAKSFLPLLARMGPAVRAKLDRYGFYPAGGGKMRVTIEPPPRLKPLHLLERGNVISCTARALVAGLPAHIAERELKVLKRKLDVDELELSAEEVRAHGLGNVVLLEVESAHVTEVFTAYGERGRRAEIVADRLAREANHYLAAEVPVGEYLADQVLLPLALAGGGSFVSLPLTAHALTNIDVLRQFLPVSVRTEPTGEASVRLTIGANPPTPGGRDSVEPTCDPRG